MTARLDGKVAFITGATSGLGAAVAERFIALGARVVAAGLEPVAADSASLFHLCCDVTDDAALKAAIDAGAEHFGGLDIVVNNAGGTGAFARVDDIAAVDFDQTMVLLLRSVVMGVRHATPHLRARGGGSVINMASASGLIPGSTRFGYATAKAAVIHFTKEAALQLAADRIRVNALAPGLIPTAHVARAMGAADDELEAAMARAATMAPRAQALPVAGAPSDVAEACAFLASDAARFVTGVVLPVDGGASAGRQPA